MIGIDEFGASSVGAAIGRASTNRARENGAVCSTVPLWPSLMPLRVSRINGLPVLLDAAKLAGTAKTVVNDAATVAASMDWSERTGSMGGPDKFWECRIAQKTLYLTAAATFRLVDIGL